MNMRQALMKSAIDSLDQEKRTKYEREWKETEEEKDEDGNPKKYTLKKGLADDFKAKISSSPQSG